MKSLCVFFALVPLLAANSYTANAASPPTPEVPGYLLDVWRFEMKDGVSSRGSLPIAWEGAHLVDNWSGTGVEIAGKNVQVQYPEFRTDDNLNIRCDNGSVMFWFLPYWASGSGPQDYGRFIELGDSTGTNGWWSIYLNPTGTEIYFSGHTNGQQTTDYLSANINWTSNQWHFVAVTYSPTNSELYIDGQFATNGGGVLYWPSDETRATNGFSLGATFAGDTLAQGVFDSVATFDYPVSEGLIEAVYDLTVASAGVALQSVPVSRPRAQQLLAFGQPLMALSGLQGCLPSPLTLLTPAYQGTNVVVNFTGHDPSSAYDLFVSSDLISWSYFGRSTPGQTHFTLSTLSHEFFLLGTMQDADNDGVTDAFEKKVAMTDPYEGLPPLNVFITYPNTGLVNP